MTMIEYVVSILAILIIIVGIIVLGGGDKR